MGGTWWRETGRRTLVAYIAWVAGLAAWAAVTEVIPCVDMPPAMAEVWGFTRFSLAALVWYIGLLPAAYLYTALAICPGSLKSIRKPVAVVVCGLAVFPIGPMFVLNGPCPAVPYADRIGDVMIRRVGCWTTFQLLGGLWTLLDSIDGMGNIMLRVDAIRTWKRKQWTAVGTGLLVGTCVAVVQCIFLFRLGRLQWYAVAFVGTIVTFLAVAQVMVRLGYTVHVHHYCIGLLVPFFPVDHPFAICVQALFWGISAEGFSRWGPDGIFLYEPAVAAVTPAPAEQLVAGTAIALRRLSESGGSLLHDALQLSHLDGVDAGAPLASLCSLCHGAKHPHAMGHAAAVTDSTCQCEGKGVSVVDGRGEVVVHAHPVRDHASREPGCGECDDDGVPRSHTGILPAGSPPKANSAASPISAVCMAADEGEGTEAVIATPATV